MITIMKTNKEFSAHSAVVAHEVVAHASQRGNQRNVTLGSVTHYAMMLLMMLLTIENIFCGGVKLYGLFFRGFSALRNSA